jgi:hypothetical protein
MRRRKETDIRIASMKRLECATRIKIRRLGIAMMVEYFTISRVWQP